MRNIINASLNVTDVVKLLNYKTSTRHRSNFVHGGNNAGKNPAVL